jgi:hypothetical protein
MYSCANVLIDCAIAGSLRPVTILVVHPATRARPDQNNDQDHEPTIEQVFPVIVHRPLTPPLFPRKNVQKERADREEADH